MTRSSSPCPTSATSNSSIHNLVASPYLFAILATLCLTIFTWPIRWIISGAPILQFLILLGESSGDRRILPLISIWPIFTSLHLVYAICSTSWLLYWFFTFACYVAIFIVCLFQFDVVANFARNRLRSMIMHLHFIDDKIAFFEIPGLEFDKEVDGLMWVTREPVGLVIHLLVPEALDFSVANANPWFYRVVRGITFSLSTLSFIVHGVEVGIKLAEDIELAIQVEEVRVRLFRKAEVGDCFVNLKGGRHEMTFADLSGERANDGDAVFIEESDVLKAALKDGDMRRPEMIKMLSQMTDGNAPTDSTTPREGFKLMKTISPEDGDASGNYRKRIRFIEKTNAISEVRTMINNSANPPEDDNTLRAAICSNLHSKPSTPHPPPIAIKVTTFRKMSKPTTRRILHRLPLLLRILLCVICYFHPVTIASITMSASGGWIDTLLLSQIFKQYPDQDKEIRTLHAKISAWLSNANFVVVLGAIKGVAQVPINSVYDIISHLTFDDVLAYRATPHTETQTGELTQVLRLSGADLRVDLPTYILPRHDHLMPPVPSAEEAQRIADKIATAENVLDQAAAKQELEKLVQDMATIKVAAHLRLPAILNQDLLDFIAALAKAGKIVELEKELEAASTPTPPNGTPVISPVSRASTITPGHSRGLSDDDAASLSSMSSNFSLNSVLSENDDPNGGSRMKAFSNKVKGGMRVGMKRMVVDTVVNERWIAKLVGRIMRKLEAAKGEVGYSAEVKIPMDPYRRKAQECLDEGSAEKWLP